MYDEEDLLPLSALQHLIFCERQWGLIHLEGIWAENRLTTEGRHLHDRAHLPESESRGDVRIVRGLRLRSLRLGLSAKADIVEFHRIEEKHGSRNPAGAQLQKTPGLWRPYPVEYKRGRPKADDSDKVQLCAQALCLEEMLSVSVNLGCLFYGKKHKRYEIAFDAGLRRRTEEAARRLHQLTANGVTPPGTYGNKCRRCSLLDQCMPKLAGHRSARGYVERALAQIEQETEA